MNADFIAGLEFWEREKGVSRETLMAAVQEALLQAAKKAVGPARDCEWMWIRKPVTSKHLQSLLWLTAWCPNTIRFPFLTPAA